MGRLGLLVSMLTLCLPALGCFDAKAMLESRRAAAIGMQLGEIDLGEYRFSLPQPAETTEVAEIYFHAFGRVANRDMDKVKESLESLGPEFRNRLLLVARKLTIKDIQDPPLTALRTHIAEVVNESLPGEPLQSVVFDRFDFSNL